MAVRTAGTGQRLRLVVGRQHAENHRNRFLQRHLPHAGSALAGDVIKMGRVAANHRSQADDRRHAPAPRQRLRRDGNLQRAGHAMSFDPFGRNPQLRQPGQTSLQQPLDDRLIEPRRHNPEANLA